MPDNRTVSVALGSRSYDVVIGAGLIGEAADRIGPLLSRTRVAIVTDDTVGGKHLDALTAALAEGGIESTALRLPPGEATKDWANLSRTVRSGARPGSTRRTART